MKAKKLIFMLLEGGLILAATFLALNIGAWFYLKRNVGLDIYDKTSYAAYKDRSVIFKLKNALATPSLPHPFYGKMEFGDKPIDNPLSSEPLFSRIDKSPDDNDVKVLIVGGSVAMNASIYNNEGIFARKLNAYFNTRKFSVYNAAFGGGKQPSQYFKLMYLDLLGFTPDIVLNIDGFNEIALPLAENFVISNPAIFPRLYSSHIDSASYYARACAKTSDRQITEGTLLPIVALVEDIYASRCKAGIEKYNPAWWVDFMKPADFDTFVRQSRLIWVESSNRIARFTKSRGIDYLHVLQPNQYFADSKPLSEWEKQNVVSSERYGDPIRKFYGLLSRDGLEDANFYDQRMALREVTETMYEDFCCHFNHAGNEFIVEDIVKAFSPVFERRLREREAATAKP